jgi:hypothetical protein
MIYIIISHYMILYIYIIYIISWDEKIVSFPFGNQATKYAS